ncbi:aspartic proteinase nepenthesin-1-like [Papaver somniferum]|uniref:aspartic proteinase nepenthesin-1-like n=1 Tax=Papaver somniferum TaxID=3469 RepID=UPI000E6FF5C0|nr:aspartic proteinase nepenthesin-1-like [Papaver somniferum]
MDITLLIIFLTISHVSVLQINSVTAVNPSGFSLKIIHSDSKDSPLYPGDHLTPEKRLQRLVQQSKDRARYVGIQVSSDSSSNETTNPINPNSTNIPVSYEGVGAFYVAEIGIGTFPLSLQPFEKNYLIVDTSSEIVWTQCAGARNNSQYFHQDLPLYPAGNSKTYEPLLCRDNHPLCFPGGCEAGQCTYLASYPTAYSMGVLAKEKFTVNSDQDGLKSFDIIMGCGFGQNGFEKQFIGSGSQRGKPDLVTGILGLGSGPRSITSQLEISTFSHCLKPYSYGEALTVPSAYLRFGSDATIGGGWQQLSKTPFFAPPTGRGPYFLNLEGISVNGIIVDGVGKSDFEYDRLTGTGGFFIDSGTPFTVMHQPHFNRVSERVIAYFHGLGINYDQGLGRGYFKTCFTKPNIDFTYPTMTLHFEGADFLLDKPETLFSITAFDFCLGIIPGEANLNLFGAMQQAGKKMLYDTAKLTLSFAADECYSDGKETITSTNPAAT